MSLNHQIARSHLESLVEGVGNQHKATADAEDDYLFKFGDSSFFARVDGPFEPFIRVYSVVAKKVEPKIELYELLNKVNSALFCVRALMVQNEILIEADRPALMVSQEDFEIMCGFVAVASDQFGPSLLRVSGGSPFFEFEASPNSRGRVNPYRDYI